MLSLIKQRCGIADAVTVYDNDIRAYIEDASEDLVASGVDESLINTLNSGVITAITFYVKANIGDDRTDTDKYMDMYRKKVFRLTLMDPAEE